MLQTALNTRLRKMAVAGTFCLVACGSASAGWLCNWSGNNDRPYYNPSNEPNWGVQQTTWRRFSSHGNMQQGSLCATGGCQPMMDHSYHDGMAMPAQPMPAAGMQGVLIQQNLVPQQQVMQIPQRIPQPQVIPSPSAGQMLQIPNQQPGSIFAPPEMTPYNNPPMDTIPLGNSMQGGGMSNGHGSSMTMPLVQPNSNAVPLMAPQPQQLGNPVPMNNGGNLPTPNSTLNPQPQRGGGGSNPVPFPMPDDQLPLPMPPTTQSNYYRSQFDQATPGNYMTNPAANYGYQQQAANPAQPISFQSGQYPTQQQTQPARSRNPFSVISRMWPRGK